MADRVTEQGDLRVAAWVRGVEICFRVTGGVADRVTGRGDLRVAAWG